VLAALTLIAGVALAAALFSASRVIQSYSLTRSSEDLDAAHAAFDRLVKSRGGFAATETRLITELPVFRANLDPTSNVGGDAETITAMAECAHVCEHLHLPLQAGSDRTLARMHRGYTAERYLERLRAARAAIPDLAVTTDLIVGFPGETEADFAATLEVVEEARYDAAYTFVFSPRPGTPAAEMTDDFVTHEIAQERMQRLVEVVERHALRRHEARVGRVEEVLVDGPSKKDSTVLSGRTRQNKLVHFAAGDDPVLPGAFVDVRITHAAPHWLRGDLVRAGAPPTPARTRIPVTVV
jgi:tRNA-2-methylthio-N6-dimethylallyladenosine synthase